MHRAFQSTSKKIPHRRVRYDDDNFLLTASTNIPILLMFYCLTYFDGQSVHTELPPKLSLRIRARIYPSNPDMQSNKQGLAMETSRGRIQLEKKNDICRHTCEATGDQGPVTTVRPSRRFTSSFCLAAFGPTGGH